MISTLKIKTILYLLIFLVTGVSVTYMYVSYQQIKESTRASLNTESINRAYEVTKKMSALNDKAVWEYDKYNNEMYEALRHAQKYFEKNGQNASLEVLRKELNDNLDNLSYHIYLVNKEYVIQSTSFKPDKGLDFHVIPEALKVMIKTFKNPNYIDLSSAINDTLSNRYKKYIVQKAKNKDYLIQISVSIEDKQTLKNLLDQAYADIPNLLDTEIYVLFLNDVKNIAFDVLYTKNYTPGSKGHMLVERNLYNNFSPLRKEGEVIDEHNFKHYINKFIKDVKYKDFYYHKDGKYIHKVLMSFYSYVNYKENTVFVISIELDESDAEKTIDRLSYMAYLVWFILFIILIFFIFIIQTRVIKPIESLQLKMKTKETVDIKKLMNQTDEIGTMSLAYNQLLQDLKREILSNETLLEEFKNFTANTIHQVRTPVSVIKIVLEMLETKDTDAILQIKASLISIEHMYDSLSYALHHEHIDFPPEILNLSDLLKQRIALFSTIAQAYDTKIEHVVEDDLMINMNLIEAEYLIDNNLSNSIKYGATGKTIVVTLSKINDNLLLSFDTFGEEIENIDIIFNRYHREHKDKKGHGIGLHMVDTICKNNNILIKVDYFARKNKFLYFFKEYVT
ncbi:HAMP domain-containing histidine kinase [Sulfurimonas sp. MAG313]|nr:HAMP domain-containing sensor histidine kinase [Sulfurimonas sp. MAG313]MDF1880015.1 HAMP domain-containing histidine kinase [Sulfurimonas sp. MAG313]